MADDINGRTEDVHGNHTGYFFADLPMRDLFAAFALAGIAAANMDQDYQTDAAMAYGYADAMIVQRNKPTPDSQESEKRDG